MKALEGIQGALDGICDGAVTMALEWRAAALAGPLPPGTHLCETCAAPVAGGEKFVRHMACSMHVVQERARLQAGQSYSDMLISAKHSDDVTRVLAVIEVWHRGPWDRRKGIFRWTGPERRN